MRRCPLYTPEQKLNRSDRQRHPTTLKCDEWRELSYLCVKVNRCGSCANCKVCDMQIQGIYYCKVKRKVIQC